MRLWKDLSLSENNYFNEEQLRHELFKVMSIDIADNIDEFYNGNYGIEYTCNMLRDIKKVKIDDVYNELLNYGYELGEITFNKGEYQEYIFYLGLQLCDHNKWLLIDNYYSTIKDIILVDFISKGYDNINEGLLECVNRYINDNSQFVEETLRKQNCFDDYFGN